MNKNLLIALVIIAGTMGFGCTATKDYMDVCQEKTVTCTTSVSLDNSFTKALDREGVKSFAVGDQIAVIYKSSSGLQKALSEELTEDDIVNGKYATFTVSLTDPVADSKVRYIYPAATAADAMPSASDADSDGTVKYTALSSQDGTLTSLASNLDLCTFDGTMVGSDLPRFAKLDNQFSICAFTIRNGGEDITANTTKLVVKDGSGDDANTYTVNRGAAAGPIYVAVRPVENAILTITITNGSVDYTRSFTAKTLKKNSLYPIDLGRIAAPSLSGDILFGENTEVRITGPEGAEIHYTLNGDTPTAASNSYTEALTLIRTLTVKAIAIKDGVSSSVSSMTFTKLTPPVISGDTPFKTKSIVMITTGIGGAKIYYTTDRTIPTANSILFESAITLEATTTIKAVAVKDGVTSAVASATFTKEAS